MMHLKKRLLQGKRKLKLIQLPQLTRLQLRSEQPA